MKNMEGVREVANVVRTADGNQFRFPVSDYLTEAGEQISENPSSDTAELNPSFTEKQVEAFTFSSKEIRMSRQVLTDTPFDILSYIENVIAMRMFNVLNPLFTNGSGSTEPEGITTGASLNVTATNTSSLTRKDLINTVHKVARPYRTNGAWNVSDNFVSEVRKLDVGSSDARPLYQASPRDGEPDRIEGYPITINNDLAAIAAGNIVATFGDHTQYMVRDVEGAEIQRLQEIHARKFQDSFVYFERHDGKLLDTNAITTLTMKS
jgi:HK97 family phage major capsid protein